ncbi:MAG TPA: hypothetical protein VFF87_10155 [Hyphomicrobium sp.]|nr:hypothetical protein [Hyphomicrobium sp.]
MFKFIGKQWRGEAPFWTGVFGASLLLPWALVLGGLSWLSVFTIDQTPYTSMAAAAVVFTLIGLIALWQFIGTWRATSRARTPARGRIARWTGRTIAGTSLALSAVALLTVPGAMASYYAEATDADWIGQRGHTLTVSGDRIVVSGHLSWGLYYEFVDALAANPGVRTVVLNSPGGHYAVGLRMGRLIHERGLTTVTTEMCGSACTYAFIGGHERLLGRGARLGFHAMAGNTEVVLSRMQAHAAETLAAAEVPEDFIVRIFATPSDDVWYPSTEELRAANLVTGSAD